MASGLESHGAAPGKVGDSGSVGRLRIITRRQQVAPGNSGSACSLSGENPRRHKNDARILQWVADAAYLLACVVSSGRIMKLCPPRFFTAFLAHPLTARVSLGQNLA